MKARPQARDPILTALHSARVNLDELEDLLRSPVGDLVHTAQRLYFDRRKRDAIFPARMFREPAWDLLLGLYIARAQGQEVNTMRAAELACAPGTTLFRLLDRLERARLIERRPNEGPRRSVELTPLAVDRMCEFLSKVRI